jgi:hypothetical protein
MRRWRSKTKILGYKDRAKKGTELPTPLGAGGTREERLSEPCLVETTAEMRVSDAKVLETILYRAMVLDDSWEVRFALDETKWQ